MNYVIFLIYSLLIVSAMLMVLCINPIHSVLFFMSVFFLSSLIFILLHADFIGLVFLLVYVGAIAVLFIFVVMMLNINKIERDNTTYLLIGGFVSVLFSIQLIYILIVFQSIYVPEYLYIDESFSFDLTHNIDELAAPNIVTLIGIAIFYKHPIFLIFSGITLLLSLIGSVYLTNTKTGYSMRRQDNQFFRNNSLYNLHVY